MTILQSPVRPLRFLYREIQEHLHAGRDDAVRKILDAVAEPSIEAIATLRYSFGARDQLMPEWSRCFRRVHDGLLGIGNDPETLLRGLAPSAVKP